MEEEREQSWFIKKKVFAESKKIKNTVDSNNCLLPEGTWHRENI